MSIGSMHDRWARAFAPLVRARLEHIWTNHAAVIVANKWDVLRAIMA